ncbi:MAG: T9SS type A sorting domain-containing protein [Bacteroidota bacterium]
MKKILFSIGCIFMVSISFAQQHTDKPLMSRNKNNSATTSLRKQTAKELLSLEKDLYGYPLPKWSTWQWDTILTYDTSGIYVRYTQTFDAAGNVLSILEEIWQNNSWMKNERHVYAYDDRGNVHFDLDEFWFNETWNYHSLYTYVYNGSRNNLTCLWEFWQANKWELLARENHTYNSSGSLLTVLFETKDTNNTWIPMLKNTYSYNEQGKILTYQYEEYISMVFVIQEIDTYTYDFKGSMLSSLKDKYNGSIDNNTLISSSRNTYTNDVNGNILIDLTEGWEWNGIWKISGRSSYVYDGNNNLLTEITENINANTWYITARDTYTYDSKGNILSQTTEKLNNGSLVNNLRVTYSYDGNSNSTKGKCESWINDSWQACSNGIAVFSQKIKIFEFYHPIIYRYQASFRSFNSGLSNPLTLTIYPNPASDKVNLYIDNINLTDLTLNIYNIVGELITSNPIIQNQFQINVENLSRGMYIIEAKSKDWSKKQKLIIQR